MGCPGQVLWGAQSQDGSQGLENQSKVRKDDLERTWIHGGEAGNQTAVAEVLRAPAAEDAVSGQPRGAGAGCAGQLSLARADFWPWVHSDHQPHHPGTHRH